MTVTVPRLQPGDQIEVLTRADGVQLATVQAVVDGSVLVVYERAVLVSNTGERSYWQWFAEGQLLETAVT